METEEMKTTGVGFNLHDVLEQVKLRNGEETSE